ncbi:uncharacterized protein LOC134710544 [Mytilus trossulus]|uniref:uncharacterized protein LOC134710544 n=1 Tax=Mytilus trossulus TaxID=6551 RepID=UPI003006F3B6
MQNVVCSGCLSAYDVRFKCTTCKPKSLFCPKCRNLRHDDHKIEFSENELARREAADKSRNPEQNTNVNTLKIFDLSSALAEKEIIQEDGKNVKLETICAIDEHTLWALGDATVFYITLGEDLKVKSDYSADRIFEISYSKAGFLYLTQNGEIGRINLKGKYEKFADESPYGCCGIYAYDSGDIVVGVIENETDAEPFHKIVMYNTNGELTNYFQYNIVDTPDFIDALPQQITVNPLNGDIIIIDWNCEVSTRVVGLSKTGNIHWMFHGPFDEPDEIFCPDAVACADSGRVLILTDKTLLVLSQDGNLAYRKPIDLESIDCLTNIGKYLYFVASDGFKIHKLSITCV